MTTLYHARWVLPITSAAIDDGAVAVEGARIVGIGKRAALAARFPEARALDFGDAAILPGLVNCHSHLELTALRGYLETEEGDFFAWLKKLTVARLERMTLEDLYDSAAWGAVEAARAGITCVGDASDSAGTSMAALRDVGLRATVYQEVFCLDPGLAREEFEKLREKVAKLREAETSLVRVGVSPHAPYTVCAPLLELVTELA
ncbi:MAG TPA: amidohydrolase family protein, partial [Pyrinomonadaceae bacterium]|nr:amidohydrolase family protein [Pyrinomonadaceae bacterium]